MVDAFVAVVLGLAIGFVSGLFGVGGSSISTPLLRVVLHVPRLVALGSPLPVTIPTALAGGLVYHRQGFINWRVVLWVAAGGTPSVLAGSLLTAWIPAEWLMFLVAGTMLIVSLQLWRTNGSAPAAVGESSITWARPPSLALVAVAAAVGLLSGLLANGGGFLLVPGFVILFGARLREAAATSLPCVASFALPGSVAHAALGHIDGVLALQLAAGVIPATYFGASLSLRFRRLRMRRPFAIFLAVFGVYFFFSELLSVV